jgi:hypothetical protein
MRCLSLGSRAHGANFPLEFNIPKLTRPHGPQSDQRFNLHKRQPRADKLDPRQRRLCHTDPAFREALRSRVGSPERLAAFLDALPFYLAVDRPCGSCGDFRKRTRDRSCYGCHLSRSRPNFTRMRAGEAPQVSRSMDSHLDLLERRRAERSGDHESRQFGGLTVTRYPTGRLEVVFPDGFRDPDLSKRPAAEIYRLMDMLPELKDALVWAGWY